MNRPSRWSSQQCREGKANGTRECAPEDRLRVPAFTVTMTKHGWHGAKWAFAHPTISSRHHALRQKLRDLDRVQRGAFEQLIRGHEHRDRMAGGIAEIFSDTADQHVVLARRIDWHREVIFGPVVHDPHTRRAGQNRTHLVLRDRLLAFESNGLAMR